MALPQNGAIAIDNSSNIYIVGYTKGELDGNANSGVAYAQDDALDFFILKYDSNGNKQWNRSLSFSTPPRSLLQNYSVTAWQYWKDFPKW